MEDLTLEQAIKDVEALDKSEEKDLGKRRGVIARGLSAIAKAFSGEDEELSKGDGPTHPASGNDKGEGTGPTGVTKDASNGEGKGPTPVAEGGDGASKPGSSTSLEMGGDEETKRKQAEKDAAMKSGDPEMDGLEVLDRVAFQGMLNEAIAKSGEAQAARIAELTERIDTLADALGKSLGLLASATGEILKSFGDEVPATNTDLGVTAVVERNQDGTIEAGKIQKGGALEEKEPVGSGKGTLRGRLSKAARDKKVPLSVLSRFDTRGVKALDGISDEIRKSYQLFENAQ